MIRTEICLTGIEKVELSYEIPEHLKSMESMPELRESDLALLDAELRENGSGLEEKISSGVIWRMRFPGMIVDVRKLAYCSGSVQLTVSPIHPHRADLAYKNDRTLPRNAVPLTVNALLRSAEGSFVLGIRGGNVESGKVGLVPGGHVDYNFPYVADTLETFMTEFEEELGYTFDSGHIQLLGLFTNSDAYGINVLYSAQTNLAFPEILERWKRAKDADEHNRLFRATDEDVRQLARIGRIVLGEADFGTTPFFQDCFKMYIRHT